MKTSSIHTLCIALIFLMTSCKSEKKKETPITEEVEIEEVDIIPVGDNSMTSLDWDGIYKGELPCADCEGIKTELTINSDKTYTLHETYLGKDNTPLETKGTFKWDNEGQRIQLSEDRHLYFVGENTLTLLDSDGNRNTGELAELYVLKKVMD